MHLSLLSSHPATLISTSAVPHRVICGSQRNSRACMSHTTRLDYFDVYLGEVGLEMKPKENFSDLDIATDGNVSAALNILLCQL